MKANNTPKNNFMQAAKELFFDDAEQGENADLMQDGISEDVPEVEDFAAEEFAAEPETEFIPVPLDDQTEAVIDYEKPVTVERNIERATTVIAEGTVIKGSIFAEGHLEVLGRVEGDVNAKGDVKIVGNVFGNISGECVELISTQLKGNLNASSKVIINTDTVIVGDIRTNLIVFDGKMKGEIHADGMATLNRNTYLSGNVTAKTIALEPGATVNGIIKTTMSRVDESKIFDLD